MEKNDVNTKKEKIILTDHLEIAKGEFDKLISTIINEKVKIARKVLDVGCETIENKDYFMNYNIEWYGMDVIPKEDIIKGNMNNIPFSDNSFHFIFCSHAFEHTDNPIQTLKEFKRTLKAGGILFMTTPYPTLTQIFAMNKQHLFCLTQHQIEKLLYYCNLAPIELYIIKPNEDDQNTWNIITIARSL